MGLAITGEIFAPRMKITRAWVGKCASVPDVIFDDAPEVTPTRAPAAHMLSVPPIPTRTVKQEHMENVVLLLDGWAEWIRTGEPLAEGAPRQCLGAPDARIHSFEDMEIETNKRLVREVHTAVWELQVIEREAIMTNYGLKTRGVWRAQFEAVFEQAVESLFNILKTRISC
jgi:hypothetical protein